MKTDNYPCRLKFSNLFYLFSISYGFILYSCKDELVTPVQKETFISFNVSIDNSITKGLPIDSAMAPTFTEFGIFAYETTGTFDEENVPFSFYYDDQFNNKAVTREENNKWVLDRIYYWPQSGYISFFAYAPYTTDETNGLTLNITSGEIPTITYKVPAQVAVQPDLMVAIPQKNIFRETVNIRFAHALAAVGVNVSGPDVKIDSIWISGISVEGTLAINYNGDSPQWSDLGNAVNEDFLIGLKNNVYATEDGDSTVMASDGYLMMIPQTLGDDAKMMIKFQNMDIKTISLKTSKITEWQAGQKYIYYLNEGSYDFSVTPDSAVCTYLGDNFNFNITSTYTPKNGTANDMPWSVYTISDNDTVWIDSLAGNGGVDLSKLISIGIAPYTVTSSSSLDKELVDSSANVTFTYTTDLSFYTSDNSSDFNNLYTSANCYMVNKAGNYKFPCWVMGNGLLKTDSSTKGIPNNENCFPSEGELYVNYNGSNINSVNDLIINTAGATAELLWQDAPGLITDVGLSDDNGYITFTVPKVSIRMGNALIAIKDASGTIMWSWHIWVTPWKLELFESNENEIVYFNHNIGQCYKSDYSYEKREYNLVFRQNESNIEQSIIITQVADSVSQGYNSPYYQWGRKDIMLSADGMGGEKSCFGPSPFTISSTSGSVSLQTAIKNPNVFYKSSDSWLDSDTIHLWYVKKDTIEHKSIYDPSPIGFRVPNKTIFGKLHRNQGWTVQDNFGIYYFQYQSTSSSQMMLLMLMACGSRAASTGVITGNGTEGNYWSATFDTNSTSYGIFFDETQVYEFVNDYPAASGYTITPVREYTD